MSTLNQSMTEALKSGASTFFTRLMPLVYLGAGIAEWSLPAASVEDKLCGFLLVLAACTILTMVWDYHHQ